MNFFKSIGKLLFGLVLFLTVWFLSFVACAVIGSFFYDGIDQTAGTIYGICIIFIPIISGTVVTVRFQSNQRNKSRAYTSATIIEQTNVLNSSKTSPNSSVFVSNHPPVEPILPAKPSPIISQSSYSKQNIQEDCVRYGGIDAELLSIDLMEGHEFEYWCASLLRKIGFSNVEVTQGSGDQGVDVLAEKDGIRYAIQCKCYSKDLGNKPVQEVNSGKMMPEYHCQIGVVMTNRYFTKGARDLADATGTLLWDRDWIKSHIQSTQFYSRPTQSQSQPFQHVPECSIDIDELLPAAIDVILETKQASISMLQRRLNLGYAQAARTMDALEERGIVSPFCGSKPRDILITKEQWIQVKNASIH